MIKQYFLLVMIAMFATGCAVSARTYVLTKERVDINNTGGNAGYLSGSAAPQVLAKKTRKIYVLELSKATDAVEPALEAAEDQKPQVPQEHLSVPDIVSPSPSRVVMPAAVKIPPIDDDSWPEDDQQEPEASVAQEDVTYTVQKDDTLQKIAKKFYNNYNQWTKIYDANKAKIKNPNVLKAGTVLTIPTGK